MAYNTVTATPRPAQFRSTAEQQAGLGRDRIAMSNARLGMPVVSTEGIPGFAAPHDAAAQDIWNQAASRVLNAGEQDLRSQANRWSDWWGTSTAPSRAATPDYSQEQVIADYLGGLGQSQAQRDVDVRAKAAADAAKLAAARRGGGGGRRGGGGGRRRGGGGAAGGAVMSAPVGGGITDAEIAAWIRMLTPPAPTSRYSGGMGGQLTFEPYERPVKSNTGRMTAL